MKARFFLLFLLFFLLSSAFSYEIVFKEQFYKLFHTMYQQYPDDVLENIYWLERAVGADFCNPQYALTKIATPDEWEKYRYLFMMHVNVKLAEQHLRLGRTWDKQIAYFYDAPWKNQYLADLETAEKCYTTGLVYWNEARLWAEKAGQGKFRFMHLSSIQFWEDESARIASGKLNYEKTINREVARLKNVRDTFVAMDEKTY